MASPLTPALARFASTWRSSYCMRRPLRRLTSAAAAKYPQPSSSSADAVPDTTLNLSDSCIQRLREITTSTTPYLRVSVEGGGCSGFQYKFELAGGDVGEDDRIITRSDSSIIIDTSSLEYLKGSTVDYQVELIRSAFRIVGNPKAESGCSCGASFSIKVE